MSDISQSALSLAVSPALSDIATGLVSGASKNMQLQAIKKLFDTIQINSQTASYTIQESDHGKVIEINSSSAVTVIVPNSFFNGFNCLIVQIGAGTVTLSPAAGVTVRGAATIAGLNGSSFVYQRGTNDFVSFVSAAAYGAVAPDAPTSGMVDDTLDTFNWTNNPSFTALSDYEYTLNGGSSYATVTVKPLSVGNIALAIGQVGVRVKAAGGNPASSTLFNASPYTVSADFGSVMTFPNNTGDLTFASNRYGTTSTDANFGHGGRTSTQLLSATDGWVGCKDTGQVGAILGFSSTTALGAATVDVGIYFKNGSPNIFAVDGASLGSSWLDTGVARILNNYYRIKRTGSVWKIQTSANSGASWTDVYTMGVTYTGAFWGVFNIAGDPLCYVEDPRSSNLV